MAEDDEAAVDDEDMEGEELDVDTSYASEDTEGQVSTVSGEPVVGTTLNH